MSRAIALMAKGMSDCPITKEAAAQQQQEGEEGMNRRDNECSPTTSAATVRRRRLVQRPQRPGSLLAASLLLMCALSVIMQVAGFTVVQPASTRNLVVVGVLSSPQQQQQQADVATATAATSDKTGLSTRSTANTNSNYNSPSYSFWDTAKICVMGGDGGNGCVSFRREKGQARGGPNGGRGGNGGSVYAVATAKVQTLVACKRSVHVRAQPGKAGQGKLKCGVGGSDAVVYVPLGTVVRDGPTKKVAGELSREGQTLLVARGGRGGRGNAAFQTNRRTAPKLCEKGASGANRWIELELRLLAQVGFLGLPNAGKSTLLSVASAATPKIANYPFTTTVPHLGVCNLHNHPAEGMVLCDIPGLIEGAAHGAGMGLHFLKHVQRCKVLLHILDGSSENPVEDYHTLQRELQLYDPVVLASKPQVIVLNKLDLPDVRGRKDELVEQLKKASGHSRVLAISAATTDGVSELFERLSKFVAAEEAKENEAAMASNARAAAIGSSVMDAAVLDASSSTDSTESFVPEISFDKTGMDYPPDDFKIESDPSYPGQWRIKGEYVEAVAQMTHWEYPEALERFRRQLEAIGVADALIRKGAEDGDLIMIDKFDFDFAPGRTNPYIPAELLEDEEDFLLRSGAKSRRVPRGSEVDVDPALWRPFSQGGYLDMDLDELALLEEGVASSNENDGDDDGDNDSVQLEGAWDELFDLEFDEAGEFVLDEQDEVWTS
jgi:GTPase